MPQPQLQPPGRRAAPAGASRPLQRRQTHGRARARRQQEQPHRFLRIQIAASWGEAAEGDAADAGGQSRFAALFRAGGGGGPDGSAGRDGSPLGGAGAAAAEDGSPASRALAGLLASIRAAPLPDAAAPWVAAAVLPTAVWCITWAFSGGLLALAQSSMTGMCAVAKLLFPALPLRGTTYDDVAVSLLKMLQAGTDDPSTWSRPGLWAPAWLLRWLMCSMFTLAAASSGVAASFAQNERWLAVSGVSQALTYATCLLFMLPLGTGLSSVAASVSRRLGQLGSSRVLQPTTFSLPRLDDTTLLALKLAGCASWPCISAAAVLMPVLAAPGSGAAAPPHLWLAAPQVAACASLLVVLLTSAALGVRFAWELARRQASSTVVQEYGFALGAVCAAQAVLNVVHTSLCLASGQLAPQQLGLPLLSTLVLARVAWSTWRLWRIEATAASTWLQVLTLAPGLGKPGS